MENRKNGNLSSSIAGSIWRNEAISMATLALSRGATVPVAVHEGTYGRKTLLSRPLQAPEKPITTAECSTLGNELKKFF
jgi:hypothetical protein